MATEIESSRIGLSQLQANPEIPWATNGYDVVHDKRFEAALDSILRWHNGVIHPPEGFVESDLHHIEEMEDIFWDITAKSPHIAQEVTPADVGMMIRVHDMAEILIGDYSPTQLQDLSIRKRKIRGEPLSVIMMTRNLAEPAKEEIREYFNRYEKRDSHDKEALMTKYLDVIQGSRFAVEHGLYGTIPTPGETEKHLMAKYTELLLWSQRFAKSLEDPLSREELYNTSMMETQRLCDAGYKQYIDKAIQNFSLTNP